MARAHIAELEHIAALLLAQRARRDGHRVATHARRPARCASARVAAPRGFFWDGEGENPYLSMLANADTIIVTGDSVNMVGEAVATAAPVYVVPAPGRRSKIDAYLAALADAGAIRMWRGALEDWGRVPVNATPDIASAVAQAYLAFAAARRNS